MRKILFYIPLGLLFACGEQKAPEIEQLKAERDSLKSVRESVSARIAEINALINQDDQQENLMQVTTLKLKEGDFSHYLEVYGNVESSKNITVYPEVNGTLKNILVEEGQEIQKGQLIAKLDDIVLQNNLNEIETGLALANTVFNKQKKLWEKKIGSEIQYLEAKNQKESLEAAKKTLLSQIAKTEIKAPFGGVVDEIFPKIGELAGPQMPLARLVNLNNIYIKADVSEVYLSSIKVGSEANIELPSLRSTLVSRVVQVGQFINPNNRTFKVKIGIPETDVPLKPNLLTKIKIKDFEVKDSALVIPTRIIQQSPQGEDYVMLINLVNKGPLVSKQVIKTGVSYNGATLIKGGLSKGAILIDKGARSVNEGQEVEIAG